MLIQGFDSYLFYKLNILRMLQSKCNHLCSCKWRHRCCSAVVTSLQTKEEMNSFVINNVNKCKRCKYENVIKLFFVLAEITWNDNNSKWSFYCYLWHFGIILGGCCWVYHLIILIIQSKVTQAASSQHRSLDENGDDWHISAEISENIISETVRKDTDTMTHKHIISND